ncbi:MAG: hypothetical protein WKG07_36075 [Hymenobacter sp.]
MYRLNRRVTPARPGALPGQESPRPAQRRYSAEQPVSSRTAERLAPPPNARSHRAWTPSRVRASLAAAPTARRAPAEQLALARETSTLRRRRARRRRRPRGRAGRMPCRRRAQQPDRVAEACGQHAHAPSPGPGAATSSSTTCGRVP